MFNVFFKAKMGPRFNPSYFRVYPRPRTAVHKLFGVSSLSWKKFLALLPEVISDLLKSGAKYNGTFTVGQQS